MCYQSDNDWEIYPRNLHLSAIDVDDCRLHRRITQATKDLFVDQDGSTITYMDFSSTIQDGLRDVNLVRAESSAVLDAILAQSLDFPIIYTWSRLQICEEHFRKLFTRLKVHPDFLDIVHLFCEKIRPLEESFNGFFMNYYDPKILACPSSRSTGYNYNVGYNVKYVARHGRKTPMDPFSIREVGVYQQFFSNSQISNWIFLQAPAHLQERLRRAFSDADETVPLQQFQLHSSILLCVSNDWREYLSYLEEDFSLLVDRGFYTNIKGLQFSGDVQADYSDIRKIQILADKLQRLQHIVKLNIRLGGQLKSSMKRIQESQSLAATNADNKLDKFIYDQQTHFDRLGSLLLRSTGIGQLVQNILEIRATEAGKKTSLEMQKLTEQGIEENRLVKRLTEKASRDTKSMMIIASIFAVFLPATFLATLFGSNFFVYSQNDNKLTVASNFWIYVVLTAGFSGAVVTSWLFWKRHRAQRGKLSKQFA